jgi:hypothetical protein
MMFPSDTSLTELEAITVFKAVHAFSNVMQDERLQLTDKPLEDSHFENRHEPGIFELPNMPRDGREVMIEAGKALVCPELAFKMVSSQVSSHGVKFGQGLANVCSVGGFRSRVQTVGRKTGEVKRCSAVITGATQD